MGVKFGMEEGTFGPLLHAKFHPHRCNVSPLRGEKPQNRPLSKRNTGRFALRAMLPVIMITSCRSYYRRRSVGYTVSQQTSHLWLAITFTQWTDFDIFGRNVIDKVSNQKTIYYATSINVCFCTIWQNKKEARKLHFYSHAVLVHYQNSCSRCLISAIFLTYDSYSRCCMTP